MVWKKLTEKDLAQTREHFSSSGYVMQWYAMASEVVLTTLGPEWWKNNCTSVSEDPDEFLRTDDQTEEGRYDHQDRIVKLGHMLYGLRAYKGFEAFITSLKTRALAPTFFELWVASILFINGYEIVFVEATGERGNDYDLTASRGGRELYIEAKSRRAGPILNETTLTNALTKARKQLPNSGPSIVFVEIPGEWTRNRNAETLVGHSVSSFFRNTSRVNGVVVCWHQWIGLEVGRASVTFVRQYENPKPRSSLELGTIVKPIDRSILPNLGSQDFRPSFW
jgi:hypothetical protein